MATTQLTGEQSTTTSSSPGAALDGDSHDDVPRSPRMRPATGVAYINQLNLRSRGAAAGRGEPWFERLIPCGAVFLFPLYSNNHYRKPPRLASARSPLTPGKLFAECRAHGLPNASKRHLSSVIALSKHFAEYLSAFDKIQNLAKSVASGEVVQVSMTGTDVDVVRGDERSSAHAGVAHGGASVA
ncbi:hypothetical protein EJB05_08715, partial [Eragrostis curvula]